MKYHFNEDVAKDVGVEEAIMLSNLTFWIKKNEVDESKKHFHDGIYWTFNSKKAFKTLFPFWSESQIKRILKKLVDNGYLITGNYNKLSYDKTLWYAIGENRPIERLKSSNRLDENDQPIPDKKTQIENTDNIYKYISTEVEKEDKGKDIELYNGEIIKSYGKEEIDLLIGNLKAFIREKGYEYDSKYERKFAKHILSKKFSEVLERHGMNANQFGMAIITGAIAIGYFKGTFGLRFIYQNYAEIINKVHMKKEITAQKDKEFQETMQKRKEVMIPKRVSV